MITLLNKFDDNYMMQKNDILDVAVLYMKENNLENYLKDIVFSNDSKYLGYYNLKTQEIVLNDTKIISFCHRLFDKLQRLKHVDENYYAYYFNFYYLYIIFHELTHINQKSQYEKMANNNVFCALYELCRQIRYDDNSIYGKYHNFFPMEIEANNNGFLKAYQMMSYTKLPNKECRVMYLQYLRSLLLNYQKVNNSRIVTPLERLLKKINNCDSSKIFELLNNSKLSKIDRLNLGLNISILEYDNLVKEEQKILLKTK